MDTNVSVNVKKAIMKCCRKQEKQKKKLESDESIKSGQETAAVAAGDGAALPPLFDIAACAAAARHTVAGSPRDRTAAPDLALAPAPAPAPASAPAPAHAPDMDSDRFIQDILARPEIWMARHPHHRNKLRIKKQWIDLKNNYPQFTVDDLKKRWKNLRDTYRKELKRLPQARPGVPADNFRSNWKYFDALGFLRDEVSLPSNEPVEETTENDAHLPPERDPPQGTASPASSKSEDDMPEMTAPSTSKRRDPKELREEFLKIERKKLRILEEEVASSHKYMKSDNYHFLMSLLPEMDKLPPLQKMRLRTKISQAVLDEVSLAPYEDQQQQPYTDEQIHYTEATMEAIDHIDIKEESINMYD